MSQVKTGELLFSTAGSSQFQRAMLLHVNIAGMVAQTQLTQEFKTIQRIGLNNKLAQSLVDWLH